MTKSKKYNNIKITVRLVNTVCSFLLLILFVITGLSEILRDYLATFIENKYLLFIAFVYVSGFGSSLIFFPLNYYSGYYIEHKYELSNQNFLTWWFEKFKSTLVGAAIGIPILLVFYYVLNLFGNDWWLPFAIILFLFSVVLSQIFPVIIFPLFYKTSPLKNKELTERIMNLATKAKIKIANIYSFDMSKDTKKANAAFTGMGKTKRIILGDTLINNYTPEQIETVIAHEMGHFARGHIIKNIVIGTLFSFLTFYLLAVLYNVSLNHFGFADTTDIAALPILAFWGMVIGLVQTPISNFISRKFEYEADKFAIETTNNKQAFIATLTQLNKQNLGDEEPNALVEWYSYSHPSIKKRIAYINSL